MKISVRVVSPPRRRRNGSEVARASRPGMLARLVSVARHVPFSVDLVAMYYVMLDVDTPLPVKGTIATALLYAVSPDFIPGPIDDVLGLGGAATLAYAYRKPKHVAAARKALGKKKNPRRRKGTQVQSLIFDRDAFTVRTAHKWAMVHGFAASEPDVTENTIRLRQIDPARIRVVATIPLRSGVQAVIGFPKR